jgi:hypothetical protein
VLLVLVVLVSTASGFLLRSRQAILASLVLEALAKAESVELVLFDGLAKKSLLRVVEDLLVELVRDFEELEELERELFEELSPFLACAAELMPKKISSITTTHKLVSFFITFSCVSTNI